MELRHRLTLVISAVFLVSILLIGGVAVPQLDRIMEEHTNRIMLSEATRAAERIDHWLDERSDSLRMLSVQIEFSGLAPDDPAFRLNLVNTSVRFGDKFPYLYCGFADGRIITTRNPPLPDSFDPRTRPWYRAVKEKHGLVITEPFADARSGQLIFSIACPVNTPIPGVLATDVALSDLSRLAHEAFIHPEAEVMLVSKYGQILFASDTRLAAAGDWIETVLQGTLQTILAQHSPAGQASGLFTLNGREWHLLATTATASDWQVVVYLPQEAFAAEKTRLWESLALVLLFGIGGIFLAIYLFVGKLTRPLEVIAARAKQFHPEQPGSNFLSADGPLEVRQLAESLDAMRMRLITAFHEKDSLLEETQAQNEEIQVLYSQVKAMNETLSQALWEKQRAYLETIKALADAIEAKDYYTRGHSERVRRYAVALAESLGWDDGRKELLQYAAILHDIGKIGVPREVLNKPGRLTAREFELVKRHPVVGWRIVNNISHLQGASQAVRQHHEQLDGSGYPDGASGAEICPMARILAIADAFDAMTSARPYRPAMSVEEAAREIGRGAGRQFDAEMAATFRAKVVPHVAEIAESAWHDSELAAKCIVEPHG